jgi:DNA N-6-adenine-methyltransferase (Dam)
MNSKNATVVSQTAGWNRARYRDDSAPEKVVLTPAWLVDRIRTEVFGGTIDLDPATTPANPCRALRFIALPEDGLAAEWRGNVFVNPPWGDRAAPQWIEKAVRAASNGARVVMLAPTRTDTRWFHRALEESDELLVFKKRLDFTAGTERRIRGAFGALFASGLFAFNTSLKRLSDIGVVLTK